MFLPSGSSEPCQQGAAVAWQAYDKFPETVRAAYVTALPCISPTQDQVKASGQSISEFELAGIIRAQQWSATEMGYMIEHASKVCTILQVPRCR